MFKMARIKNNGQVNRQQFSISEMEDYGDQFNDYQNLNLEDICGCWHSQELCPTLLVYKDHTAYKIALLHVDELGQVQPEVCTLQDNGAIRTREGNVKLLLDENSYLLTLVGVGEYYKK